MAGHTDALLLFHFVWATRNRRRRLPAHADDWWKTTLNDVAQRACAELLAVGVAADHVHCIARVHPTVAVSEVARVLKGASAHYWNEQHRDDRVLWQSGYWVRSIAIDALPRLLPYVSHQRERHAASTIVSEWEQNEATEPPG